MIAASRRAVVRVSSWAPLALAGALPFCAVSLTAAVNGGYFPTEWGWPALAFLLVTVLVVLIREHVALGRLEVFALGALAAFAVWTLLSVLWSPSATEPVLSFERTQIYVAFLPAVFLTTSRRSE